MRAAASAAAIGAAAAVLPCSFASSALRVRSALSANASSSGRSSAFGSIKCCAGTSCEWRDCTYLSLEPMITSNSGLPEPSVVNATTLECADAAAYGVCCGIAVRTILIMN